MENKNESIKENAEIEASNEAQAEETNVSSEDNTTEVKLEKENVVYVDTRDKADIPSVVVNQTPKPENNDKTTGKKVLEFLITTLNGMAIGLFATLIIGTIINTIGKFFPNGEGANSFCNFMYTTLVNGSTALQYLTGAGIGVGIALSLKFNPLQTIVLAAVGELAAYFSLSTAFVTAGAINQGKFQIGDPLTIFIVVIVVALAMKYILRKKTPVDILIVPLLGVSLALIVGLSVRFPAIYVTYGVQYLIAVSTNAVPFIMGVVIAVLMGMALTAPISSAAIGAMVFTLNGVTDPNMINGIQIASGAAIVGCCCQMVGFAVQSRKDNNIGMVISIGIGTSMLQFKNILRKPMVWLPTIIASAILGPISTCWLKLVCMGSNAGMGTAGLVGQIGTISSMGADKWQTWVGIFGLQIIAPAIIVFGLDILFRRFNLYKEGDLVV